MEFEKIGLMLDCSRNAVPRIETLKALIDLLAKMGYNRLELYTEDTYEIKGRPYFGYLRGRYSGAEIKEIDAYAAAKGIELTPCIQVLALSVRYFVGLTLKRYTTVPIYCLSTNPRPMRL